MEESTPSTTGLADNLPWGSVKSEETASLPQVNVKPGEFVAQTLFIDFVLLAEKRIAVALAEPQEKLLSKTLQRGEDAQFDQVIIALGVLSENCLPSVLRSLFAWYEEQKKQCHLNMQKRVQQTFSSTRNDSAKQTGKLEPKPECDLAAEKRGLAIDFIFCLVLIEILQQLPLHPGIDELVDRIIQTAFQNFSYKGYALMESNSANARIISELFSEVVGHLSLVRFSLVRKRFKQELDELRSRENSSQNIISLLMGMKFFRVKMAPIEDFESSMRFLHDLAAYFVDVKEREIKHALAGLFIEILLPVAANAKTEVNVPSVKSFVEMLYSQTLDLATKKKHSLAFFPLLTCLLCISHKQFFLSNWHYFLTLCLSNLKHKDPKMSRVALESLYRLVWVYVVRIKCESNTATLSRLQSICNSLFPKGGRGVMPQRLDFAFKEVIFDLLCVGRPIRTIYSERMNIGLRALLVIADNLQQKDGPPPMPRTISTLPSGSTLRVRRTYLARPLLADVARNIGIELYYGPCRRAFDGIIRLLDTQVGRPLIMTVVQTSGKETDDILGGERKPKIDLFRTCIAAIPRLLPDGMSRQDVVELLARLTLHVDEELRLLACQALQNLIVECTDWHNDVIYSFLQFFTREIPDVYPHLIDSSLRLLLQILSCWKNSVTAAAVERKNDGAEQCSTPTQIAVPPVLRTDGSAMVLHCIEGFALTMLCQSRSIPRKLAITILKEVKGMFPLLCPSEDFDVPVIDVLDDACSYVLQKYVQHISSSEKAIWLAAPQLDFLWISEKISSIETNFNLVGLDNGNEYFQWDPWAVALSGFTEEPRLLQRCPTAVSYAWPAAHTRLNAVFAYIDPNSPQNDSRASLLRTSKSKATSVNAQETVSYSSCLGLWQKYLVVACAIAPPQQSPTAILRSISPVTLQCDVLDNPKPSELKVPRISNVSATHLFRLVLPLLRCEMTDMRDSVVLGLGSINPLAFDCLLEELTVYIREACERKQENVRRKRRRDILRLQLVRLFEMAIFRGCFASYSIIEPTTGQLKPFLRDFIENSRCYLEADHDVDTQMGCALHLHFAKMVSLLIRSFPIEKRLNLMSNDLRKNLFYLFASWSGRLGLVLDKRHLRDKDFLNSQESFAVMAMCSVLTCGHVFDPHAISDENGYIFGWLEALVQSRSDKISEVSEETLTLLLEFNSDATNLLDWIVDHCYSSPSHVADQCFRAVAAVFLLREYPCDFIAMFNLALLYVGYPLTRMRNLAVELMQMLEERFFDESALCYQHEVVDESSSRVVADQDSSLNFTKPQMLLSEQMSQLHPEITMPIFSEVSLRLQSARPARRASMLHYLVPWLHNVELVDPFLEPPDRAPALSLSAKVSESQAMACRVLKGEGWGSTQASEMILNNMLYITVQFGNEHPHLLENLWASLVSCWPQNVRIIIRYLSVMLVLAPDTLLDYAKRIIIYFARVCPERVVNVLTTELETVEIFRNPLERTEVAPYYRWVRKEDNEEHVDVDVNCFDAVVHSAPIIDSEAPESHSFAEEEPVMEPAGSVTSLLTLKAEDFSKDCTFQVTMPNRHDRAHKAKEFTNAFQLPMPAYGGHYCPLSEFLPSVDQFVILCHRCHIAVIFLTDVVLADMDVDWSVHLPLMLHISFLGLDHSRAMVNNHCKQLLVNLAALYGSRSISGLNVTRFLNTRSIWSHPHFPKRSNDIRGSIQGFDATSSASSTVSCDSGCQLSCHGGSCSFPERRLFVDIENPSELAIAITDFLASKEGMPLWPSDDLYMKSARTSSVVLMSKLAQQVNRFYSLVLPSARIESRWAQTALHIAVCCSNRHYASRSFQIMRALHVPLTSRMINSILARLAEIICEHNEDMLEYVSEIMATLQASVLNMEVAEHSLVSLFKPSAMEPQPAETNRHSPTHQRSTSCYVDGVTKPPRDGVDCSAALNAPAGFNMPRSKSAQLLWIAVSMLESDFESEFSMGLKLLDKLLDLHQFERQDCFDRLTRMVHQLGWANFPGIQRLVLKGCTFNNVYESTVGVVVKLTPLLGCQIVGTSVCSGLALGLTGVLPYAIIHYEQPTKLALSACDAIAEFCRSQLESADAEASQNSEHPLEHLATIMKLYQKRSFRKECTQWTRCVIQYFNDLYPTMAVGMLTFLTEILDRGPSSLHTAVLQIMKPVFVHIEFSADCLAFINGYFLKVVSKHVQGPNWKEASAILNIAVSRSSSFSKPSNSCGHFDQEGLRKELPGRTMEFRVDISSLDLGKISCPLPVGESDGTTKRVPCSDLTLKRSLTNQVKVREHLIALLNASGLRVGLIRSPSIIFSQSSHDVICEQMSSAYSSSGELTAVADPTSTASPEHSFHDITSETYAPVFKEFDFLEGEQDSLSESSESCFNWLTTLRSQQVEDDGAESPSGDNAPENVEYSASSRSGSDLSDEEGSSDSIAEESTELPTAGDLEHIFLSDGSPNDKIVENVLHTPTQSLTTSVSEAAEHSGSVEPADRRPSRLSFNLECPHHSTGQIEETWNQCFLQILSNSGTIRCAELIFTQLIRETTHKVSGLIRDACHFLSMSPVFHDVTGQFLNSVTVLLKIADFPFLFVSDVSAQSADLYRRHKYYLMELNGHLEAYLERKEHTIKVLNNFKSALKLQLLITKMEHSTTEQGLELCRSLHKLLFQIFLIAECISKVHRFVMDSAGGEADLSQEIAELHRDLLCAANDLGGCSETKTIVDGSVSPYQRLIFLIGAKDARESLLHLRSLRLHHRRAEVLGCCEQVDVEVLLLVYCQMLAEKNKQFHAIIGSGTLPEEACITLMEFNITLSEHIRALAENIKKPVVELSPSNILT
uniref:Protein furry-like protein-like n=1 Tax=Trichuris muris TaxID=70415 RepID=A0A5S6QGF4_TRIMR